VTPIPWRAVVLRLFVVVLPSSVVGSFLVFSLLPVSLLAAHPNLVNLQLVGTAALPGLLVGLLVVPRAGRMPAYLGLCAGSAVVCWLVLHLIVELRLPDTYDPPWTLYLTGPLSSAGVQTLVAGLVWFFRRGARPAG
jgi:Na+/proline symporter